MKPNSTHVSFVVPMYRSSKTVATTLRSLRAGAPENSEIIVVDDASSDDTASVATPLANHAIIRSKRGGAARARNDGARAARGDVIFFVDADVSAGAEAIAGAVRHLEGEVAAVFGAYAPLPAQDIRNVVSLYKNLIHHFTHLTNAGEVRTFWAGFGAVKRVAFEAVGGFDPAATSSADTEDIDLGYRLTNAGYKILLNPQLQVLHHKRYTIPGLIASDVVHRAIPWTRAILKHRITQSALNLHPAALVSSQLAYIAIAALVTVPFLGPWSLAAAAAALFAWAWLNRRFLAYAKAVCGVPKLLPLASLLFLYYLYGPVGFVAGVVAHFTRAHS